MATSSKAQFEAIQNGQYNGQTYKKKKYKNDFEAIQDGQYTVGTYKPQDIAPVQQEEKSFFADGYDFGDITKTGLDILSNVFNKNNRFKDGYQIGDVSKTLLGSAIDIERNLRKGAASTVEGATDFGINLLSGLFDEDTAQSMRNFAQKDITGELSRLNIGSTFGGFYKIADLIDSKDIASLNPFDKEAQARYDERLQRDSLAGDTADQLAQGVGQLGGQVALQSLGIPWQFTAFTSSAGNEMNNAFKNNANYGQAFVSGLISGAVEVGTEYLGGGANKLLGMTSLGSKAVEKLGSKISNKLVAMLTKAGLDMAGEGLEEVLSGYGTAIGQKLTYMTDKEINELYSSDEALEEFISGALVSGIANIPGNIQSAKRGENAFTGMTDNEQKVYDKLVEERTKKAQEKSEKKLTKKQIEAIENDVMDDFTKGNISTDKIESILGHTDNVHYMVNQAENMSGRPLTPEELNDINLEAYNNYAESIQKDDIIKKNYYEDELRHQKFNVDLDSLDDNMKKFYQTQIDEGVVDNSTKAHNYMDMMAKIWKDKGIMSHVITDEIATKTLIDDAVKKYMEDNNITSLTTEQRQELENKYKEEFKDTRVNGYMRDGELYININSKNALETIVGHEITHLLEKNTDLYDNLRKSLKEYAESKGEYKNRLDAIKSQPGYNNLTEDAQTKELTADLVGDYIFTSQDYINSLAQNRNLFQKIYDEIKYLVKQVTAGSDEQRKLNKAVKMFEKAYKEMSVKLAKQETNSRPKYSIQYLENNEKTPFVELDNNLSSMDLKEQKEYVAKSIESMAGQTFGTTDGDSVLILKEFANNENIKKPKSTAKEMIYGPTTYSNLKGIDTKTLKNEILSQLDETLMTSKQKKYKDDVNNRHKDYNIVGFDTKQSLVFDGSNMYKIDMDVAVLNDGTKAAYDMKRIAKANSYLQFLPQKKNSTYMLAKKPTQIGITSSIDDNISNNNENVNYSLSTDSNGRELTKQQQEYFKDSKVRDDEGKLKVMYHGTPTGNFNVFDSNMKKRDVGFLGDGFYFTSDVEDADEYSKSFDIYDYTPNSEVKEVYLNIKNPYIIPTDVDYTSDMLAKRLGVRPEQIQRTLINQGYDGIIYDANWHNEYVVFNSNQIKNIDNLNPTSDDDIRYSLSQPDVDNQGNEVNQNMKDFMANSYAREDNDLSKPLVKAYHGTTGGEFTIFDNSYGNVEGDFGKGFYFSSDLGDVEQNYEDGGKDFDIKVSRLAERIESEQDIPYEEAEELAREQLYQGGGRFDAYLNITKPAIVGETRLFSYEDYMSDIEQDLQDEAENYQDEINEYAEEYDMSFEEARDDYLREQGIYDEIVNRYLEDDIENAVDTVRNNLEIYNDDELRNILWESVYDGGIEVQALKDKINNQLEISDENGDLANNEAVRLILESLGYDGIIDNTVSDKFQNMGLGSDTTHYIVFNSNQIKNVDNTNPTESPDIRYSLTQKVDSELDDLTNEQYEYFKNTKAVNENGELELVHHGTPNQFNIFDINKAGTTGVDYGNGFYFTNAIATARAFTGNEGGMYSTENEGVLDGYVNIEKPADRYYKTMTFKEFNDLYNALNENPNMYDDEMGMSNIDALLSDYGDIYNDKQSAIKQFYESYDDDVSLIDGLSFISNPTEFYKTLRDVTGYDGIIVENPNGWDNFEKYFIAFNPDQFKLKSNKTPTNNVDMNLSLSRNDEIAPVKNPNLTYGGDIAYQEDIAPTGIDYTIDRDIMDLFHQEIARKGGKKVQLTKPVIAKEKSSLRNSLDTLSTMFVNQNTEIDNLAKESGNKNIKFAGDMLNNYSAEAQNDVAVAQTDNYGNAIGKSVQQLFEPAKIKGLEAAFNDYLINYSNIDRWARGKGSQTPVDVSERLVKNYEEQHPEFKKWAKDIWKYGENVRKNWLEAGMIKQSMYDLLSEAYPHYVPYISDTNNFDAAMDKLNELKARPIKRAVGGATELFPVEEALTRYTFAQKRAYRQNELFKQIYNTLQTNPGQRGADVGEGYFTGEEPNLYRDDSGNYITALFDGEEHKIQVSDDLFKSLRNDMQTQIKDLENKLSIITKPLQTASNIRRKMLTSWSPSFTITNPLKDIQDAFFNSKHLKEMAKNYIPGIKELWTGSTPEARQFLALYGEGNLMGQFENESGLYDAKKGNKNNKFLKGLSKVNNIMELAPRYAEFKASLQAGESLAESMYNAREITTNFSRGGVITKALNRNGFTFLNASVQGFDKFIRNFSGENGARGIASSLLRAAMLGVAPAVFNELAFGGGDDKDEDYDALPDYIKDNYYLIKTGDGSFVRIPKGRMLSVFGSAARRTIELAEGEENAFEGYLSNVNNQIGINNPEENNIFSPLIQAYGSENGTAWYGGDIVPTRLQDKPKGEQYDASTDKMSIWLGEHLGISPYKINYVLDQYTGGIGDILLPMITDEATSNGSLLAPVVDKFTADSTTDNKYVSDFYTKNDELKVKANSSKATDDDYLRNQYMYSVSKEMSQLYAERRNIQSDNSLSKSEKYEKSQAIKNQINQFAKTGLDNYNNVSVTGNYAHVGYDMGYYKNAKGNWTPIDQKDIIATESIGLNNREMSSYYTVKNDMYNIDQKYESQLKNATDEQKTELNAQKKVDIINSIKNADLPDSAKAVLYDKKYASTETLNAVLDCNIDFDSYLDLQAQNFTADKNIYGKTINGSKKRKVYSYINNLDMPYEQKIMLAKLEYKSDDTYNREIIDYLNNDNSISYQDMTEILKAMGFKVDEYGNITWE